MVACGFIWCIPGDVDDITYQCTKDIEHLDEHYDQRLDQKYNGEPVRESITAEAERIVSPGGERATTYGGPGASFNRIAELWSAYLGGNVVLSGRDVANMMNLLKVSRTADTYHRDSYVDIVGYSRCVEMMQDGETQ